MHDPKMTLLWRSHFQQVHLPKNAGLSSKSLGENPMKSRLVGLTIVWQSVTLPNFFPGLHLRNRLRTKKNGNKKPEQPGFNPPGCVSNFPQKNFDCKLKTAPPYFPRPEIRSDRCVPGNDVAPPVAPRELRG